MEISPQSTQELRNTLSNTVIIDIFDLLVEMEQFHVKTLPYNRQEMIRQAFLVFDKPGINILDYARTASLDYTYIVGEYSNEDMYQLNQLFSKVIVYLYFKCYEHKLFVGTNYPTIPRFPYFLENANEGGCVLKLDTVYF